VTTAIQHPPTTRARVQPTVPVATVVFVVYAAVFIGLMKSSGHNYDDLLDTAESTFRGVVVPLLGGTAWLVAFLAYARWDHVFRDARRLPMGFWFWLAPVLMLSAALLRFGGVSWGPFTGNHILAIVTAGVLVGFAEETLFRGIILRALRNGARHEVAVVVWSSLWFGFFHLTNLIVGSPLPAVLNQCVIASISGVVLYLARRARGLLVFGMVVHGLWDMSTFAAGVHPLEGSLLPGLAFVLSIVANLIALVFVVVLWRRKETVDA
jgi:membrane protease YdiL (CAAX protease family)